MEIKRLWHQLRILMIPGSKNRMEYLKKRGVFHACGNDVYLQSRKIPLYSNLIAFHNNIRVASNVTFLTHDVMHTVLGNATKVPDQYCEKIGCIEIFDNVFIGSNVTVLYGTRIGPNALVAAGSVVTKDVPEGCIVGGIPAKVIGHFDEIVKKRASSDYPKEMQPSNQRVGKKLENLMWKKFRE